MSFGFSRRRGRVSIPDSAIHRWKFDEGSGSTAADSIGTADGSITGATWSSGTWVGDTALDGDGTDDYVATGTLGTWGSNLWGSWAVAYTVQTSAMSGNQWVAGADSGGTAYFQLPISWDSPGWNGQPALRIQDGASNTSSWAATEVDDGSSHRVVIQSTGTGLTGSEIEIWVDATDQTLKTNETQTLTDDFSDFSSDFHWFCRWLDGSRSLFADVILDDCIIADDSWTSSEIQDDYDRQPWS